MSNFPLSLSSQAGSNCTLQSISANNSSSSQNLHHPFAQLQNASAANAFAANASIGNRFLDAYLPFAENQSLSYFAQQQPLTGRQQTNLLDLQFNRLNASSNQTINAQSNNQITNPLFRSMDLVKYQLDHEKLIANGIANGNALKSTCTNLPTTATSKAEQLLKETSSNKSPSTSFNTSGGNSINFLTNNLLGQSAFNRTSYSNALRIENLMQSKSQTPSGPSYSTGSNNSNLSEKTLNELEALVHEQKRLKDLNNNLNLINLSYPDKQSANESSKVFNQFNETQFNTADCNHLLQMLLRDPASLHLHQIGQQLMQQTSNPTTANLFDPLHSTTNLASFQNQLNYLFSLRQSNGTSAQSINPYFNPAILLSSSLSSPSTVTNQPQMSSPQLVNNNSKTSSNSTQITTTNNSGSNLQPVEFTCNENSNQSSLNCTSSKSSQLNSPISDQTNCSSSLSTIKLNVLDNRRSSLEPTDRPILKDSLCENEFRNHLLKRDHSDSKLDHPNYPDQHKASNELDSMYSTSPLNGSLNNQLSNRINYLNATSLLNSTNSTLNSSINSTNSSSGGLINDQLFNSFTTATNGHQWDSASELTARLLLNVAHKKFPILL